MSVFPAGAVAAVRRDPPVPCARLKRLEELAAATVRAASPVRFDLAQSEAERTAIYRQRHRVVMERGWARPEELPGGVERDAWDDVAVHVGGWLGDELVASARLVFPAPGRRLPVEALFDLTVAPAGQVVHVDRLIVARGASDRRHRILLALTCRCWLETNARGCHVWAGVDSRQTTRLYRAIGFEVEIIGPGRSYWNEERFPVRLDVLGTADAVAAVWATAGSASSRI